MDRWYLIALVSLVGCGPTKYPVRSARPTELVATDTYDLATCKATKPIVVTDATGTPVADARVVVRQLEISHCPSIGASESLFTTMPARTDRHGVARICDPLTFYPDTSRNYCPHHREAVSVLVVAPAGAARLTSFDGELRAVLGSCDSLRATDAALPCTMTP